MTSRAEQDGEALRRALKAMAPHLQEAMKSWQAKQEAVMATTISEALAPQYRRWLEDFNSLPVPALRVDYSSLFPDLGGLQSNLWNTALPALQAIRDAQREQIAEVLHSARRALQSALPPNWRDDRVQIPGDLEALLLDEGLPLAWVPPTDVVVRLFSATTASERRKIIGSRWKVIAQACSNELGTCEDTSLRAHVEFAQSAAEALLSGNHQASQALSANLLDTILRAEFSSNDRNTITGQKARPNLEDYPIRLSIVLGGIWGAHGEFWPNKGDKIPRMYSRHGSVHGVSRRQYSRINAVLALMHVVSLIRVIEVDLRD